MKVTKSMFLLIAIVLFTLALVPKTLNYQGKLLDTSGIGIDGTLNMTFRLYNSETGGTNLWEKTIPNVSISKGLFSVELKDFPDSVNFINSYFLEIQAGTETLTPREKLSSSAYSIRANTVEHAIQSVHTSENPAERTGRMVFRAGDGVTLSDTGDSIKIIFEGVSGGSSGTGAVTGIIGGAGLSPDDSTAGLVTIDTKYDNATIGLRNDSLYVKAIDSTQITNGGISRNDLSSTLLTDLDDAQTLGGHPASYFGTSGISGSYIQNQSDSTQTANFRISGNGYFNGRVGIGTNTPSGIIHFLSTTDNNIQTEQVSSNGLPMGITARKARGSIGSRIAASANDAIWGVYGGGYYGTEGVDGAYSGNVAAIRVLAAESFTSTSQPTTIDFATTPSGSTSRSTRMTIAKDGNIGIGTSTPAKKLEVIGSADIKGTVGYFMDEDKLFEASGTTIVADSTADEGYAVYRPSTAATGTMWYGPYITLPGGNYIAQFRMKVSSNSSSSNLMALQVYTTGSGARTLASLWIKPSDFRASNEWQIFSFPIEIRNSDTILEFVGGSFTTAITDAYLDYINVIPGDMRGFYSTQLTTTTTGNVGIGTTTPTTPLHIIRNDSGNMIKIERTDASPVSGWLSGNSQYFSFSTNKGFMFFTGSSDASVGTERIRINSSGYVGINTTDLTHYLHVNGVARSTQSNWVTSSDIRLKDIRGEFKHGLNEISQINPVIFNYKKDNPLQIKSDRIYYGVVAQELQKVLPEAVEEASDGYLTVNADPVIWALVNAMKELKKENENLQKQIDELKANNK